MTETDTATPTPTSKRDRIREYDDIVTEQVVVPEWGDEKFDVRSMDGSARSEYLRRAYDRETGETNWERIYPELIIATAHDPDTGEKAFASEDAEWLNTKNARALERLAGKAMELSGMKDDAEKEAGKGS